MFQKQNSKKYDLEDRTLEFGKRIIRLAKALPKNSINFNLIDQVIRSGLQWALTIEKQMKQKQRKIFCSELEFAEKKVRKLFIG